LSVLISLMCHPDNEPRIEVSDSFLNRTRGYGNAVRFAIEAALAEGKDLVLADSDGYHPCEEIERLASLQSRPFIKPYRRGIGLQSRGYSWLYSVWFARHIHDATGGLYRMSFEFMQALPGLKSEDMTINVEVLNHAALWPVLQYPYKPGPNDKEHSKRTERYQMKLLKAML
jgi:glycosyltransferase involved in cell wall biosynthesis